MAGGPGEQCESGAAVLVARRGVDGVAEHGDGLGGVPGLAQFVAVHLQGVRRERRLGFEVACGGEAFGGPPGGLLQAFLGQHGAQAYAEADPGACEHREGGLFEVAFRGAGLQARDQRPQLVDGFGGRMVDSANATIATNSVSAGSVTPSRCEGIARVRPMWRRVATSWITRRPVSIIEM